MSLSFAWPDGTVTIWTGTTPGTAVHLAQQINVTPVRGYINQQTVNGIYYNAPTGQRADVQLSFVLTQDMRWWRLFDAATAVHMKIDHNNALGSAGILLWSGVIDSLPFGGGNGGIMNMNMSYHANNWSAYGQ